jgi:hypothetical protein
LKRPGVWIAVIFALVFLGVMIYSTMGIRKYRVEVCIEYGGRQACRTASAATAEEARRTATDNACALLTSGMTDSIACANTPPVKVTWLEGN